MRVKICGLTRPETARHAAAAGANYVGLVFYPPSPRNVTFDSAGELLAVLPAEVIAVALLVDPDDAMVDRVAALGVGMLQLHGAETPERVAEVRARTGLPVMKAIGVAGPEDLDRLAGYEAVADQVLVDARPAAGTDRPGGNALPFDWQLVAGRRWSRPWMLAGGLTPDNVDEAVRQTGARQVDVSSGVETSPGVKDAALVAAFIKAANAAGAGCRSR